MDKDEEKNQALLEYKIGYAVLNNAHWVYVAAASPWIYMASQFLEQDSGFAVGAGILAGYIGLKSIEKAAKIQLCRILTWQRRKTIKKNPEAFPFNFSESIVFDDRQGLEMLLEKTKKEERDEWGTVHRAHTDNGRAVIDSILSPEECNEKKLIKKISRYRLEIDSAKAKQEGYSGFHHYHPKGNGMDFSINAIDRFKPLDWINLLTFNMPYGPEVIGFNLFNIYIPENRRDKTRLVKADKSRVLEYLRAK